MDSKKEGAWKCLERDWKPLLKEPPSDKHLDKDTEAPLQLLVPHLLYPLLLEKRKRTPRSLLLGYAYPSNSPRKEKDWGIPIYITMKYLAVRRVVLN